MMFVSPVVLVLAALQGVPAAGLPPAPPPPADAPADQPVVEEEPFTVEPPVVIEAAAAEPVTIDPVPDPPAIPAPLRAMLYAAIAGGSEADVATLVKYARVAAPDSADAILAIAQGWQAERARQQHDLVEVASPFQLWRGRAEIGGWQTTGNSDTVGLTGVVDVTREGLRWRNKLKAQADYQESLGVTTREHYLLAWEPNRKLGLRSYLYGAAQYEADRFLGYHHRLSTSIGAGYGVIRRDGLTLDIELGPAFRYTSFTDGTRERTVAARGTMDLDWRLLPGLTLRQDASAYLQSANSSVSSTTAIDARLIGPLSAQLSYSVQYESMPPVGRVDTDTTSRAGLVYSF